MTATRIEFHAVARALRFSHPVSHYGYRALASNDHGLNILLIQSGIGPDKAQKSAQQLLAGASWDVMISTGFAGALDTGPIGTVLIGEEVFREPCTTSHIPLTPQRIVCHPDWVLSAVDKYKLKASTGAVGVDMESAAIGEVAQGHGLSFLIVRAISDGVNEDLPVDFNLFLKPSGWFSGVMHIMTTPRSWKGFLDLYRHSKQASLQLTRFFEEFFSAVSTMPPSPTPLTTKS